MKLPTLLRTAPTRGFTLAELLVALAVLSIMLVGLATAMGYVSKLWLSGVGSMDNFTKARVVLNLLDRDIQMMVLRRDLPAFVDSSGNAIDSNGNAICAFYTNVQGNPGQGQLTAGTQNYRTLSLVQYQLSPAATTPTLVRYNYGMDFLSSSSTTKGATPILNTPMPSSLAAPTYANQGTDTVFTGIVRFQIQVIDGNGNILTPSTNSSVAMTAGGRFTYDFTYPGNPLNPRIVVVSMLVLSNPAYITATQGSGATMTQLLTDFPNTLPTATPTQTFSQYWNSIINPATGTLDTTLPPAVRSGVQVFERHIPLPLTTPSA